MAHQRPTPITLVCTSVDHYKVIIKFRILADKQYLTLCI